MGLYQQFETNTDLETDGVWFPYPQPNGDIVELQLARGGGENSPYKRELRRLLRKHKKSRDIPLEQYEPARDDMCAALAKYIIKGWRTIHPDGKIEKKIEDRDGKMVPFSEKRARDLMMIPDLRSNVTNKINDFTNFQELDPDDVEGNSSPPSSGG